MRFSSLLGLALGVMLAGCATGRDPQPPVKDGPRTADRRLDSAAPDLPPDLPLQPDRTVPDRPRAADRLAADQKATPDASQPCSDSFEPNDSCPASVSAGSVLEGSGWAKLTAPLDPASDWDWFTAMGTEKDHSCMLFTSQCYIFKVQVDVPVGRAIQVCLQKDSCMAATSCVDNQTRPGPILQVQFSVSGTCGYTDDATAKISLHALDGKGGCAPYTLSYRYDPC